MGHYIAFEGIEGAGKSTVAARVAAALHDSGQVVTEVREPGGTPAGEAIRSVLLDQHDGAPVDWTEALLFAAARAQLAAEVVGPALARGDWVISDRSVYSSLAYQGAGRALGIAEVRAVNEPGLGKVWPELVILLSIEAAQGLERQRDADRIGGEGEAFQFEVAAGFSILAKQEPERFSVVDATLPLDEVVRASLAVIEERW